MTSSARQTGGGWRQAALAVVAASSLGAMIGGALPAGAAEVRLGHMLPTSHPFQAAAEELVQLISERTNGRIDLRIFPASQLGDEKAQTEQVMLGSLDLFFGTYGMLGNWVPAISVFEAPYAFKNLEHYREAEASDLFQRANDQLAKETGVRVIDAWYLGNRQLVTRGFPVHTPDDLEGKKIRVPEAPIYIELAKAMGGTPTPFPYSEVYLGLNQGALDAAENPVSGIWSHKWHEVTDHLAITNHLLQNLALISNEDFLDRLPDEDREILLSSVEEVGLAVSQQVLDQEAELVAEIEAAGVTVTSPDITLFQSRAVEILPQAFAERWGEGTYEKIQAMAD